MHSPNKLQFLTYHLIRELQLLHDGNLYDNLMLYAKFGQTFTETTAHLETLDPFNIPTSRIITSYLNRFYARMRSNAFLIDLKSRKKYIFELKSTSYQLNLAVMNFRPNPFYDQELPLARAYHRRCSQPALRSYMHTLPEILTVMVLITVYATDSSTDPEQQRRNREEANHSEFILRQTFHRIIEASTRYHTANTPVVRPHQFQEPLHDTQ